MTANHVEHEIGTLPSHGELEMEFGGLASYYLDQRGRKEIR